MVTSVDVIQNIFYNEETANVAAIEYVISKYQSEPWFNKVLQHYVSKLYLNTSNFNPPLIVYKSLPSHRLFYEGNHYLIEQMNQYDKCYKMSRWFGGVFTLHIIVLLAYTLCVLFYYIFQLLHA